MSALIAPASNPSPGYGDGRLSVWRASWRDRLSGDRARANARLGYLRSPVGDGKVLWIKSGGSRASVRLGLELLGAIRDKRLDLRIALTFEQDYRDLIEPRVRGLRKIGLGYGPADLPAIARRTLKRLSPLGLILADAHPSPNLLASAASRSVRLIAFNTEPNSVPVEAAYPRDAAQHERWARSGLAGHLAPAADPFSLFTESQVDVTLKTLVRAGRELELWWWLGPRRELAAFASAWRGSALAESGVLFVSDLEELDERKTSPVGVDLRISAWDRRGLAAGSVVWVDTPSWQPAVSSAALAAHCTGLDRAQLWDCLTGGPAVSASEPVRASFPALAGCAEPIDSAEGILTYWMRLASEPIRARQAGDRCRRAVWDERRRVQTVLPELLQRVFDW